MTDDNKDEGGGNVAPFSTRVVGISPDGMPVNNVTEKNRYDVDPNDPNIMVLLKSEDLRDDLHAVYIPRTREMPDVVTYQGEIFIVYNTRLNPPVYHKCMVAEASFFSEEHYKKHRRDNNETTD